MKKWLECLSDFFSDSDDLSQEELVDALEEEGIDVSNLERRVSRIVKKDLKEEEL